MRFALLFLCLFSLASIATAQERLVRAAAELVNLEGKRWNAAQAFAGPESKLVAFIFARTDCPISNAYGPEVRALHAKFAPRGVEFWLVYGADESADAIRKHLADFRYPCGALRDPRHRFAKQARVTVTPEAAVYSKSGELVYHGRIDDRYVKLGVKRRAPTVRDLQSAFQDLLEGKPARPASGPAVGCIIEIGQ